MGDAADERAGVSERRQQHAKALDGRLPTPDQLLQLGHMASDAFIDIRNTRDIDLANAIADAFHNLPVEVHTQEFSWSWLLIFLVGLERLYPEVGRKYLAAFDQVVGFDADPHAVANGGSG